MEKICKACGEKFYTLSAQQIYCFDCKGNPNRQRKFKRQAENVQSVKGHKKKCIKKVKKIEYPSCVVCGKPCFPLRRIYCSKECAEKARKQKYIENTPKRIKYYLENYDRIREYQHNYYYEHCTEINARARQIRREAKQMNGHVTKYDIALLADVSPVYCDILGNYISIIEESDNKSLCYTVARISREGDVEHLAFFNDYAPAEKALKHMVNENGWAFVH